MSDAYYGEIRLLAFHYAPHGWAFANGQLLPVLQNQQLFSLFGKTYGGDGVNTFALPDLQGRAALGFDGNHPLGQNGGETTHALTEAEMPQHSHQLQAAKADGTALLPPNNMFAPTRNQMYHSLDSAQGRMNASTVLTTGGGVAHENMMPFLTISFCVCINGAFPPRN